MISVDQQLCFTVAHCAAELCQRQMDLGFYRGIAKHDKGAMAQERRAPGQGMGQESFGAIMLPTTQCNQSAKQLGFTQDHSMLRPSQLILGAARGAIPQNAPAVGSYCPNRSGVCHSESPTNPWDYPLRTVPFPCPCLSLSCTANGFQTKGSAPCGCRAPARPRGSVVQL